MSPQTVIASIVEGYGEVSALPLLLRRVAFEVFDVMDVEITLPHRLPRNQMTTSKLGSAVEMQSVRIDESGGVLVLADSDDDDPSTLAAVLHKSAGRREVRVSVAVREYESWFLAGIESLREHRSVHRLASYEKDPEMRRGAKEALSSLMSEKYRETIHQPAFSAMIDIAQARRCPSFERFVENVGHLLGK